MLRSDVRMISAAVGGICLALVLGSCRRTEDAPPSQNVSGKNPGKHVVTTAALEDQLIKADPKALVIQAGDLPTDFPMTGGEAKSTNEYSHVYFNPAALTENAGADAELLGVIVNIARLGSHEEAAAKFEGQGGFDNAAVLEDIRRATPGAIPKSAERIETRLDGADRVLTFRVHYVLQNEPVYEYRYRVLVANAVANLIISARGGDGTGGEPGNLEQRARALTEKQVSRLLSALG
ncbi:MAG: hypothetical protein ACYTFA_02445 [Planctomycetota bacterium]|jgi:hypothetical protein